MIPAIRDSILSLTGQNHQWMYLMQHVSNRRQEMLNTLSTISPDERDTIARTQGMIAVYDEMKRLQEDAKMQQAIDEQAAQNGGTP